MDVLAVLGSILGSVLLIVVVVFFFAALYEPAMIAGTIVLFFLPTGLGIVCCVFLWQAGHDNLGVLVAIAGVGVNCFWPKLLNSAWDSWRNRS